MNGARRRQVGWVMQGRRTRIPALLVVGALVAGCSGAEEAGRGTSTSTTAPASASPAAQAALEEFEVPSRTRPHDVAPAADGGVWYTAQGSGELGHLDPSNGRTRHIALGKGSAPHGVVVGPDGEPWITDGGLGAIVRVDPGSGSVRRFPVPGPGRANLNTAAFDGQGVLWFTDQGGRYGRLDPRSGRIETFDAPKGRGPYGIARTPDGTVWYSSLAGSYIARIDATTGKAEVFDVPSPGGGARRIWGDSSGRLWVTEWFAGKLARFDPSTRSWDEWALPGEGAQPYAVFVDDRDMVWVSDFGANAMVRFDPAEERFRSFPLPQPQAGVRQILGRSGEVWGAESGAARLVVIRTR
jgi:virginiamycin B lyase